MTTLEIRRAIAGASMGTMSKRDMGELTREDAFEIYLEPKKQDGEENAVSVMTYRERAFHNLQAGGLSWAESEREWQRFIGE